jgi:hypothetical protein
MPHYAALPYQGSRTKFDLSCIQFDQNVDIQPVSGFWSLGLVHYLPNRHRIVLLGAIC